MWAKVQSGEDRGWEERGRKQDRGRSGKERGERETEESQREMWTLYGEARTAGGLGQAGA